MSVWIAVDNSPHLIRAATVNVPAATFTGHPNTPHLHRCWDGDCISVYTAGRIEYIRLAAIDAPECNQPHGDVASEWLHNATLNVELTITRTGLDRFTRTIAFVATPAIPCLSLELARLGHAWYYTQFGQGRVDIEAAAKLARAARIGLWSLPNPIPPWQWRLGNAAAITAEKIT